jgi:hypothetical protein
MLIVTSASVFPRNNEANIPTYILQDATLHSLLYLETALHVSGGTSIHHQEYSYDGRTHKR